MRFVSKILAALPAVLVLAALSVWTAGPCVAQQPAKVPARYEAVFEKGPSESVRHRVGEFVAVWDGTEACVFRIKSERDGVCTIEGTLHEGASPLKAVCPYEAFRGVDGDGIVVNLPGSQAVPTGKSIDPRAYVSIADFSDKGFVFKNVASYFKFEVTGGGVTKVVLNGALSGLSSELKGDKLTVEPAGVEFLPGEYFAAVAPQSFKGLTVICQQDTLTRWINEPSKKCTFKKGSCVDAGKVDCANILLGKWRFTSDTRSAYKDFKSRSRKEGNAGKTLKANGGGRGFIDFVQTDVESRGEVYARRTFNSRNHPEAGYVWKGDYWRFGASGVHLPAGTRLHIRFDTRVSGRGMKYWRLEAWDGREWINPESSYGRAAEAEGEKYSFVNTPEGETVDCTWTLAEDSRDVFFRMVCAANWSYKASDDGPGILSEPISASCSLLDSDNVDKGPYLEVLQVKK